MPRARAVAGGLTALLLCGCAVAGPAGTGSSTPESGARATQVPGAPDTVRAALAGVRRAGTVTVSATVVRPDDTTSARGAVRLGDGGPEMAVTETTDERSTRFVLVGGELYLGREGVDVWVRPEAGDGRPGGDVSALADRMTWLYDPVGTLQRLGSSAEPARPDPGGDRVTRFAVRLAVDRARLLVPGDSPADPPPAGLRGEQVVTLDVDGLPRRSDVTVTWDGGTATATVRFSGWGDPVTVEPPPPGDRVVPVPVPPG